MTRRSALPSGGAAPASRPDQHDDVPSYPAKPRGQRSHRLRRLVREVIEWAFEHCESSGCAEQPDGICMRCGTVRCAEHAPAAADGTRRCSDCDGKVEDLLTAPMEAVVDARLRA